MAAHRRETTIGPNGELVLQGLPFAPGQPVAVLVIPKAAAPAEDSSLQNSVLEFHDPLDPVATGDWELLN